MQSHVVPLILLSLPSNQYIPRALYQFSHCVLFPRVLVLLPLGNSLKIFDGCKLSNLFNQLQIVCPGGISVCKYNGVHFF